MKANLIALTCGIALGFAVFNVNGQVIISDQGETTPDPKAIIDLNSISRGVLLPRLTTVQMSSIVPAPDGLLIYNTDSSRFFYFNGSIEAWQSLSFGSDTIRHVCGATFQDERDGHLYGTVKIGDQCWMKENLDLGARINGNIDQANNGVIEKYCYDDNEANCDLYGGLYQWNEVTHYTNIEGMRGICPSGWRMPKLSDWQELVSYLGGWESAGYYMKSTSGWIAEGNGSNASGFTGLPGGFHNYASDAFTNQGSEAIFWLSTQINETVSYRMDLYHYASWCYLNGGEIWHGFSVRCIKGDGAVTQPTVLTADILEIAQTTATGGGDVILDGGPEGGVDVTARGICWNIYPSPTLSNSFSSDGTGTGTYTSYLTGLTADNTYYVRAYATNSAGTSYGPEVSFTTLVNPDLPVLSTADLTDITHNSATGGGNITNQGISEVSERGVCWNTIGVPMITDSHTSDGAGTGTYASSLSGLSPYTLYYARAYATNIAGTAYGNTVTFRTLHEPCPGLPTVSYGGQTYNTVQIGTQCWLRENLNIGTKIISTTAQTDNETIEKYCYDDLDENCLAYGGLYQWDEAMQYETLEGSVGICPEGWHIPALADYQALAGFLGGWEVAGWKAKSTSGWDFDGYGNNESGFTGLPAGYTDHTGAFNNMGSKSIFWLSTPSDPTTSYRFDLSSFNAWLYLDLGLNNHGFSVRCIKN